MGQAVVWDTRHRWVWEMWRQAPAELKRQEALGWMYSPSKRLWWKEGRWFVMTEPYGVGLPVEVHADGVGWHVVQDRVEMIHVDWDRAAAMQKWAAQRCETCQEELVRETLERAIASEQDA